MYRSSTFGNSLTPQIVESKLQTRPSSTMVESATIQIQVPVIPRLQRQASEGASTNGDALPAEVAAAFGQPLRYDKKPPPNPAPIGQTNRRSTTTTTSSNEDRDESRRRRLTMPLVYRMYESQSETLAGTVVGPEDEDFHPEEAAKMLRKSLGAGIQSSDQILIDVILSHTNFQRQKISNAYECAYGRCLSDDIEEEVGGYFAETIQSLLQPAHVYSARLVHMSISNRSVSRGIAVEIGLTSTASQLQVIRDTYLTKYKVALERDLAVKIEGLFGRMLGQILLRKEDHEEDEIDVKQINQEAEKLFKSHDGVEEIGRNLELFSRIFGAQSLKQVRAFVKHYDTLAFQNENHEEKSRDFVSLIRRNTNIHSDVRQILLLYVRIAQNMQLYFAERLYEAISQTRPDYSSIIRILVTRSEIDLFDICNEYARKYGRHILLDLQMTCSGDFLRLLTKLINPRNNDVGQRRLKTPNFY